MNDDLTLLREFARNNSEAAFATLVSRHVNLVYSVALRQVRDTHLAEEITQAVFIILARKADSLGEKTILSGWLCRTARYASANALTIQRRRQHREQEAYMQSTLDEAEPMREETWSQIAPLLDGAMEKLGQKDHDALVLRFFEGRNFAEVGAAIGASEDAAKMRVSRALDKLRKFFSKRGVSSTTAIIAGTISVNSVQAAPVALAKSVTAVAIAKGATASISTLTLIKGALKIMAWTKAQTTIVVSTAIILTVTTTAVTVKTIDAHNMRNISPQTSPFRDTAKYLSPFTYVHFDTNDINKVVVAYNGSEYELAAIDNLPVADILDFCRRQYGKPPFGEGWAQKRFAEDLVIVLSDMKHQVSSDNTVSLTLIDPQTAQQKIVAHAAMTGKNRTAITQDRTLDNSNLLQLLPQK